MSLVRQPGVPDDGTIGGSILRGNMQRAGWRLPDVLSGVTPGAGVRSNVWFVQGYSKMTIVVNPTSVGLSLTPEGTIADPNTGPWHTLNAAITADGVVQVDISGMFAVRMLFAAGTGMSVDIAFSRT